MHKCQGRSPIQNFGGASGARYKLAATVLDAQKDKNETSLFEGIDTSLASLAQYAGTESAGGAARRTRGRHQSRHRRAEGVHGIAGSGASRCRNCSPG